MKQVIEREPVQRAPSEESEARLAEIRRKAEAGVNLAAVRPPGAPFPVATPETGYYGLPLLKAAEWKWPIPAYFFAGGAAGAAALIGAVAHWTGAGRNLDRDARRLAGAAAIVSPLLLIADLGRHDRFLNMLRVFKPQSTMSVGSWTLFFFGGASTVSALAGWLDARANVPGVRVIGDVSQAVSAGLGLVMATYTGVLLGTTAIPVWNHNVLTLPVHFAASGLATAVSALELMGHAGNPALNKLGIGAAIAETAEGALIEAEETTVLKPLKVGASGWVTRIGGVLSGPVPLVLRLVALGVRVKRARQLEKIAAVCAVSGSIMTRVGWVMAARESVRESRAPLEVEPPEARQTTPRQQPGEIPVAPPPVAAAGD